MVFNIVLNNGGSVDYVEGIPNQPYPKFFVDEDGWVYPMASVRKFRMVDEDD